MINSYKFGELIVDDEKYTSDLIITQEGVRDNWWRKDGHKLSLDDLKNISWEGIEVFVVGGGCYGLMKIQPDLQKFLEEKNIALEADKTGNAIKKFNKESKTKRVIGAFHLTC